MKVVKANQTEATSFAVVGCTSSCLHTKIKPDLGGLQDHSQLLLNEIFQEDYIIKAVDLLSGFGGAMGLWLGWSVMTLGDLFVTLVKSFKAITSADK